MQSEELKNKFKGLVTNAQRGDPEAKSELILLTEKKLFKFCILLGHNRELAEDLCQETYIKAFRSLNLIKNNEAFLGWLYQIAKNIFIDLKRSKKDLSSELTEERSSDSNIETILHVQQVLAQFESEDRYLLLLIELEGLSYKEAADMIKSTEDAVRSKIHRLRHEFLKILNK